MARYIDADEAVRIVKTLSENEDRKYNCYNAEWIIDFLESMPEENVIERDAATICGYPVYETSIFVQVLQKYNVSPSEVKEFVTTLENALKVVQDSYKATYDEATKMWTGTYEVPANMAGLYKMMKEQGK